MDLLLFYLLGKRVILENYCEFKLCRDVVISHPGFTLIIQSSFSLQGSDFYFAVLLNFYGDPQGIQLRVATTGEGEDPVSFIVENSTDVLYRGNVTSKLQSTVYIPDNYQVTSGDFTQRNKGLHVYSEDGSDLSVIVVNYGAHATGEYIVYPCHELPVQQYTYHVVSVPSIIESPDHDGQAVLTGCEDDTIVTVIPTVDITLPMDPQNPSSENMVLSAGNAHTFPLHRLQTLAFDSGYSLGDLTGTQITSDKPLTVITGHMCGFIPDNFCCCEHFGGQIPPSATWGKKFILVPYSGRLADTYFKVIASEINTYFTVTCDSATPQYFSLQPGEHAEFTIGYTQYCSLISNEQVLVTQFAPGGDFDGLGDVVMSIVPPIEQYPNVVTVIPLSDILHITGHYVNIFVTNNETVYLNEEQVSGWQPVYNNNSQIFGYGLQMSVANDMIHYIVRHSDVDMGVGVMTYGFGSYTGYSYTSGTEIKTVEPGIIMIMIKYYRCACNS